MWDQHWCKGATARVAEMAPRMNDLISELRRRGVLIIHCPSETMRYYEGTAGRRLAQSAPKTATSRPLQGWCSLNSVKEPSLPIDDSDGGCDDEPQCQQGSPWRHQISTLEIKPGDAITDSAEAYNLMQGRGITNVLIMGVHQNMCVLGRPFSIRQMVYQGQNVVLVRDLTDSMYNSRQKPFVDHFTGNALVCWHIEKYWCPTITSDQILGGKPFRFAADTKPPRVFNDSN
jgi:nicotinamidase-related amidase